MRRRSAWCPSFVDHHRVLAFNPVSAANSFDVFPLREAGITPTSTDAPRTLAEKSRNGERLAHGGIVRADARHQRQRLELILVIAAYVARRSARADTVDDDGHLTAGEEGDKPEPCSPTVDESHRIGQVPLRSLLLDDVRPEAVVAEEHVAEADHRDARRCVASFQRTFTVAMVRPVVSSMWQAQAMQGSKECTVALVRPASPAVNAALRDDVDPHRPRGCVKITTAPA